MSLEFIYCPQCGSDEIVETDYEGEDGEVDMDGLACEVCGWEGDYAELVCKE
jgi:predicted RNA-binding Zn-ribbon protein involved in translation (DUF1610 family)